MNRPAFETDAWPATPGRLGGDSRLFLALAAIESADEHLDAWLQARALPSPPQDTDVPVGNPDHNLRAAVECLRAECLEVARDALLLALTDSCLARGSSVARRWQLGDERDYRSAAERLERMTRGCRWSWDDNEDAEGEAQISCPPDTARAKSS